MPPELPVDFGTSYQVKSHVKLHLGICMRPTFRVVSHVGVFGCHRTALFCRHTGPATAPVLASSSLYIACEPVPDERDGW